MAESIGFLAVRNGFLAESIGFLTEGNGFLAESNGFLTVGNGFLAESNGFLTVGNGFLAESNGFLAEGKGLRGASTPPRGNAPLWHAKPLPQPPSAYDHATDNWVLCEVTETYENDHDGSVVDVTIRDHRGAVETVAATGEHPFWVVGEAREAARAVRFEGDTPDGGAWVGAQHLSLGDQLLTAHGQSATVIGLQVRNERLKVYILNVLRLHNYAVGNDGVLVHNQCWSTARKNYWKDHGPDGKAPTRKVLVKRRDGTIEEIIETKELHHITPQRDKGGHSADNLKQVWPTEHAKDDSFRRPGYTVLKVLE